MRLFHDVSLGRKLTLIIMLTSSTALLLACVAVFAYDLVSFRHFLAEDLAVKADVISINSQAALTFKDAEYAKEVLAMLRADPHIVAGCIYSHDGKPFATYVRDRNSHWTPPTPRRDGSYFTRGALQQFHRVTLSGESVGTIFIESDLEEMNERLRSYGGIVALFMLLSSLVAFLLASRLQRLVSQPILELVHTASQISSEKNYSLRASGAGSDELGLLVSRFNEMLAQIQIRDQELEHQRSDLQNEVAARTAMNKQLGMAKEAAEAASRAKGEFLANMSHEIRTPINGILGMTELVLDTKLTQDQRECLTMARSSGESLLGLINDILDFSKVESGRLELEPIEFNLHNCVGETMKAMALRAHQKGLELAYDVSPEVPQNLIGDPGRLRQILVNLVGNAIKFTERGEVLLKIEQSSQSGGNVELSFQVTDTGIGISPEKHSLVFSAFSQADSSTARKYGGTGLGLAISARLVDLMGGKIWLESKEGEGSTFQFTARFLRPPQKPEPSALLPETILRGVKALVVDDNITNRRILCGLTLGWGMQVAEADSGPAALTVIEAAQKRGDPFRVILVDACMPVMDGFQLVEKIKDRYSAEQRGATILMLTSAGHPGEAARCRQLGIAAYLLKPVMKADLQTSLLTVLGHERADTVAAPPLVTRHTLRESFPKLRILVAEDNAVNQALVVRVLAKMGHASVVANNGKEALALASGQKFDLVFMDVQMPEMDGLSASAAIREHEKNSGKRLPIFAMTAYAMKGDRERCLQAGMDGYIAKPVRFSDIETTLASVTKAGPPPAAPDLPPEPQADQQVMRPPCWRRAEALERLDGDEELLQELCEIFLNESPKLVQKLRQGLAEGDSEALKRAAHSLKGEASYLAAACATQAARRLEDLSKEGDLAQAGEALAVLERELENLRVAIRDSASARR
jgi:two-component system, sensor histidine kinase and response regulator